MGNILTPVPGLFLLLFIFFSAPLLKFSTRSDEMASVECHPNDRVALLEFKAAFPPDAFSTWDTMVSCCAWPGVTCNTVTPHRVTSLFIDNEMSMRGSIPPAIGRLVFLQEIGLFRLPNLVGSIPHELTNLKSLRGLAITHTGLSTPIPSFIEELPLLETLILRQNNHSGPIPGSILQNRIGGVNLDLSNNQLSGLIPLDFGKIDFESIDLSRNQLTGDASFLFGQSKLVRTIDLSMNQLDFDLTNVVFPEANLSTLRLNNNHIRGIIPPQIANVANLRVLGLNNNNLCGVIPTGGNLERFGPSSYSNNFGLCLCGTPLPPCPGDDNAFSVVNERHRTMHQATTSHSAKDRQPPTRSDSSRQYDEHLACRCNPNTNADYKRWSKNHELQHLCNQQEHPEMKGK